MLTSDLADQRSVVGLEGTCVLEMWEVNYLCIQKNKHRQV